jgi:hypothetical protein
MKKYLMFTLLGMLIVIALIVLYFWVSNQPKIKFGNDRAGVITQINSLSRLETASFNIDKVIEASTNYSKLRQLLFGDKVLLIAHGEVVAGFDLTKMQPKDFEGSGSTITLKLPAPEILTTTIDNDKTRLFDRDQGIFTKGELNLEAEARQQAETAIRQAACEGGIFEEAIKNVRQQMELIFKSSGFTKVTVIVPQTSCQ